MPIDKMNYPPDWKAISLSVRSEAGWRCEWCGAKHKETVHRRPHMRYKLPGMENYQVDWIKYITVNRFSDGKEINTESMRWDELRDYNLTRIILTTAHLDRNTKNNERSNLAALCQRCHLRHDILQHVRNRKYGKYHDKEQQLKLPLS